MVKTAQSPIAVTWERLVKFSAIVAVCFVSSRARAVFTYVDSWTNDRFVLDYNKPGARIYGNLGGIAVTKFISDPSPSQYNTLPSVLSLDSGDNRIVWRYYDAKAYNFGFKGYNGSRDGISFRRPRGIAARSSGEVYVADTWNHRVVQLSYDSNAIRFIRSFGSDGPVYKRLSYPEGIALDRMGNVYVADTANNRIQKYNRNGAPILSFQAQSPFVPTGPTNVLGEYGINNGQFILPSAITVSFTDGSIYVADRGAQRIQMFDGSGHFIKSMGAIVGMGADPSFLSLDTDLAGRLYVTDGRNNLIYILSQDLTVLLATVNGRSSSPFVTLRGVAVDKSFDRNGNLVSLGQIYTTEPLRVSQFSNPMGPLPPAKLTALGCIGGILLQWSPIPVLPTSVAGYDVFRSIGVGQPFLSIGRVEGRQSTSYLDDTADPGTLSYVYSIRAIDSTGARGPESVHAIATSLPEGGWRHLQKDIFHRGYTPVEDLSLPRVRKWGNIAGQNKATIIHEGMIFEGDGATLTAKDLATGTVLWKFTKTFRASSSVLNWPAAQGATVFFTDGSFLYALDAHGNTALQTTKIRWQVPLDVPRSIVPIASTIVTSAAPRVGPTVAGGIVYLGMWGNVYAVNVSSGQLKWKEPLPHTLVSDLISPPIVTGDAVYLLSEEGLLFGFKTGEYDIVRRRAITLLTKYVGTPVRPILGMTYAQGKLFVPAFRQILAIDPQDGEIIWSSTPGIGQYSAEVAVMGNEVYAVSEANAELCSFSLATGALNAKFTLSWTGANLPATSVSAPALDATHIYYTVNSKPSNTRGVGAIEGHLVAISRTMLGAQIQPSYYSVENVVLTNVSPAISGDIVVVGGVAFGKSEIAMIFLNAPLTVVANQQFSLVINAVDASGQAVPGFTGTIALTSSDPRAVLPTTITFLEEDRGVKSISMKLFTTGRIIISGSVVNRPGIIGSTTIQVRPTTGQVDQFVVIAPANVLLGKTFSFTVTGRDSFGNLVTNYQGTVAFTSTDPLAQLPTPYTFVLKDAGSHLFSAIFNTPGVQGLSVKNPALPYGPVGTTTIVVQPPALTVTAVKQQIPAAPVVGDLISYQIVVTNLGSTTISGINIVDTVSPVIIADKVDQPAEFAQPAITHVSGGTRYVWSSSALSMFPGKSYTFTIMGAVGAIEYDMIVSNTAYVLASSAYTATRLITNGVNFSVSGSAITARIVSPSICAPGPVNAYLSLDSAFDHGTGKLADARIMGISIDGAGAINGTFGMVYDLVANQWNCFPGMPMPLGETCNGIYSTAVSVVDSNESWVAGHPYGCSTGENDYVWRLYPSSSSTWSPPMQGGNTFMWNWRINGQNGIAMIRDVSGSLTGWTGVTPGAAYFDGALWSAPIAVVNGILGWWGLTFTLDKISFPYANVNDGWAINSGSLAYLDTVNYPAPGTWVQPMPSPRSMYGYQTGVHVNAANDVWSCGLSIDGTHPTILHTTTPALSGGVPAPISIPVPQGTWLSPGLMDITFYELDPAHLKGVAVGGDWYSTTGAGPIIYVTRDHGTSWIFVPLNVPEYYTNVQLRRVRFVSPTKAYACGFANDAVTGSTIPFLVEVKL